MSDTKATSRNSRDHFVESFEAMFRHDGTVPPEQARQHSFEEISPSTVPTERYTCEDFYQKEIETVWHKVWQVAGWAYDIPNPGDTMVYDVGDIAALIVRQSDNSIKAFHNSCLHRGMRLCEKAKKLGALRCRFHGFAWNLDGRSKNIPEKWDFPELDQQSMQLPEFQVAEWQGYIFINPDLDAAPLSDFLGAMPDHWDDAGWTLSDRYKAVHVVKKIRANWKVAQEAFMEGLHGNFVHPESIMPAAPFDAMRQDVFAGEKHFTRGVGAAGVLTPTGEINEAREQRTVDHFKEYYAPEYVGRDDYDVQPGENARQTIARLTLDKVKNDGGVDLTGRNVFDVLDYVWYNVFPNFMPWPTMGYPLGYWFLPDGGAKNCVMNIVLLVPFEGERPASAEPVVLGPDDRCGPVMGPIGDILDEDMANMELLQRGLESSSTGVVNLSQFHESRLRHFHRTLSEYVGEEEN